MGKRSAFERNPRDFYPTPYEAVIPLIPHLDQMKMFAEPCAGDGTLSRHLSRHHLSPYWQSDIGPQHKDIHKIDALALTVPMQQADCVITNPPWDRKILHPMIEHFTKQNNFVWLLLDADWAYTKQSAKYMKQCAKIVAVGRVKWIPDSKMTGKDNCAWYCFKPFPCQTVFVGREE